MFPCTIKTFIESLCIIIVVAYANGQDRKLESKLNPGCLDCNATVAPLIYTRAQGPRDTIHQIWDFTDHVPSVAYIIGSPNSTLKISWKQDRWHSNKTRPDKFDFSETPSVSYSFAAAIDSIIDYNDLKDNGRYDPDIPESEQQVWSLNHTSWTLVDSVFSDKEAMVAVRGQHRRRPGTIEMKMDILPFEDYGTDLPHLIHTANSTLVDLRLVNFTERAGFNSSRLAVRLLLASADPDWGSWTQDMRKSLDDEHTPGVFEIIEIRSKRAVGGGFVQFRPVAYTEPERAVSSSTDAYITRFNKTELPARGILRTLYRDYFEGDFRQDMVVEAAVVSFGLGGDGFYKHHNFTAWSFTIGYGSPPLEGFSLFVIIIISIGLGVPSLLALSGAGYMLATRCRRHNPPARFTNDD